MADYAAIMNYAIPFFLILIIIEHVYGLKKQIVVNRLFDTISSLSSGITNVVKDVLGLSIIIISYQFLYQHLALLNINNTILVYVLAFIGIDFAGYWVHRWSHEINIFWNKHIIHHSSEEFNLSCALRQSVSEIFALFTFTYIPMALIGIPPMVIAITAPIHLFAQFWYHTTLIDKMGQLENILVTPSHHRVHHSINPIYIDKNYSQIFIIWDKIFGTFQQELASEPPIYGVTNAVKTWNPWKINYMHVGLLILDAWRTKSWKDKIRIWFMSTGWRPEDVKEKYPIHYTKDIYSRPKYDTVASKGLKIWSSFQLITTLIIMLVFFNNIGHLPLIQILLIGTYIFLSVYSYTSVMDGDTHAFLAEIIRSILGFSILSMINSQNLEVQMLQLVSAQLWIIYQIISVGLTFYFSYFDKARSVEFT